MRRSRVRPPCPDSNRDAAQAPISAFRQGGRGFFCWPFTGTAITNRRPASREKQSLTWLAFVAFGPGLPCEPFSQAPSPYHSLAADSRSIVLDYRSISCWATERMEATVRPVFDDADLAELRQAMDDSEYRAAARHMWQRVLDAYAANALSAQQAGSTRDPDRLGAAEAERMPFWVYTGERP